MRELVLRNKTTDGIPLEAVFLPDGGMNLARYRWGDRDLIDPATKPLYEERFAGLGALIGPHFHHRLSQTIPPIPHEERFPHIARLRAQGVQEPFSHGIARYAPWHADAKENRVQAVISSQEEWNGVSLAALEGQNFAMQFSAELTQKGLVIDISVASETDSIVGLHYYWRLPPGKCRVVADVAPLCIREGERVPIPEEWGYADPHLDYSIGSAADFTFHPFPNPTEGNICLVTEEYQLTISYTAPSQENAWQLYHPQGASYVCIEPVSAQDPRHPNLTASQLHVEIGLVKPKGAQQ